LEMHALKLCKQYLAYFNNGDLTGVLSLFASNAAVTSPLSGTLGVEEFHQKLFANVKQSRTSIKDIFATVNDISAIALHFSHTWLMANGNQFEFEGVNVFELNENGKLFSKLTLIYDSAPLR
jgi:amino acid permease